MQTITIGRNPGNTIVINDPTVSRSHCQITSNGDGTYSITDLGSSNGTFVNGNRVSGTMPLRPGDMVVAGNASVQWQNYVGGGMPMGSRGGGSPIGYQPPMAPVAGGKSNNTGLIIGIAAGVLVVVIVLILALTGVFKSKEAPAPPLPGQGNVPVANVPGQQPANPTQPANPNPTTTAPAPSNQVAIVEQPKEPDPTFAGYWHCENNALCFDLDLYQNGKTLRGNYATVMTVRDRMDYDDNPVEGTIKGNTAIVKFRSTAWEGSGTATITMRDDGTLSWKVTNGTGEYIIPDKCILKKSRKKAITPLY